MAPLNKSSPKVSGIILSGGTSSRFQLKNEPWQDKALITQEGITLLEKTILSLMEFCNEIIVVVNSQDRLLTYQPIISTINPKGKSIIRFEVDNRNFRCSGPTLGLLSGLMHMTNDLGIVVPVDIPLLDSSILSELLSHLNNNSIVVPYWKSSGKIEPLLFAFKKQKVLKYIHFLGYIRRSRADDIFRTIPNSLFLAIASGKENLADRLFLSINDREKFVASIEIQTYSNYNIFDLGNSLSISSIITEDLLGSLTKFLKQNAFLTLTEDTISRGLTLAEILMKAKMFFHAGILLNSMLELCSDLDLKNNESLVEKCLMAFSKEAERWKQLEISFLELHALTDAIKLPALKRDSREILKERITNLKKGMKLTKKNHSSKGFSNLLEEKVPGFLEKAKTIIQESEKAFNREAPAYETDFLWDHSYRVGKIAYKLASLEGLDPFIPTVSALLHDAGKFNLGQYHKDEIPEEEHSATIAENIL
ncbi:MAG: NTP transferase domain-containing protein, partial [Candidatus Heimdallarchaeota archaeon]